MTGLTACPFCEISAGQDLKVREIARSENVVVFFPINPVILGHCMVIPRRHVEEFADLTEREMHELMLAAQTIAKSIQQSVGPDGVNLIQSSSDTASQSVSHVHVHVLPYREGDQVGEIWTSTSNYTDEEIKRTLAKLRASTTLPTKSISSEDLRQHLSFVQNIIARMAQSSSSAKSWLLPVVTAAYGYAFIHASVPLAALGILASTVFGLIDIEYLRTERKYRDLYERIAVSDPKIPTYSLNYMTPNDNWKTALLERLSTIKAWAIWPFYGTLLVTGIIAVFAARTVH